MQTLTNRTKTPFTARLTVILLLAISVIFSSAAWAEQARLRGGLLTLPVVEDGREVFTLEMQMVAKTFPLEFELVYSERSFAPVTLDSAYFLGNDLIIPAVIVNGVSYWAEFKQIGSDLFRVDSYGVNRSTRPPIFDNTHDNGYGYGDDFDTGWQHLPGEARDIGVGADGSVWALGANEHGDDYGLYVWEGHGWYEVLGSGVRLDVDPYGDPWVINYDQEIFHLNNGHWESIGGRATDIGIGGDGSVWVLGTTEKRGGYEIFHLGTYGWQKVEGSAIRIDVDQYGIPWVINHDDEIFRLIDGYWQRLPGHAKDIGIGADGSVWVIGANERAGGYGIYRWNGYDWDKVHGSARQISVGPDGRPWVVNHEGDIYRRL